MRACKVDAALEPGRQREAVDARLGRTIDEPRDLAAAHVVEHDVHLGRVRQRELEPRRGPAPTGERELGRALHLRRDRLIEHDLHAGRFVDERERRRRDAFDRQRVERTRA